MTTDKQTEANRRNAQASTGPRTEEGKAVSGLNALKHGLTSVTWVLPTEDREQYERLRERMLADLNPVGTLEEELADEVVNLTWRLRRAESLELGIFACGVSTADEEFFTGRREEFQITEADGRKYALSQAGLDPDNVVQICNPDIHEFLTDLIEESAFVRRTDEARLATAFIGDAAGPNALSKLSRYETTIVRRRNNTLDMLAARQTERRAIKQEDIA